MAKKTVKSKTKSVDYELEGLKNLSETIGIVEKMQSNMNIMNENIQYACDKLEEIDAIVTTMRGRMGL
jgi:hypothetical protein